LNPNFHGGHLFGLDLSAKTPDMGDEPRADISAKWVKWDGLKVWIRVPHNPLM